MLYSKLEKSNIIISKISFGTIPLLKGPFDILTTYYNLNQDKTNSLVKYAFEKGINFFDTATNYEYADAEKKLGKALKNIRNEVFISSKSRTYNKKLINSAVKNSLKTLDIKYLDFYFIHQLNPINFKKAFNKRNGAFFELIKLKKKGLIRHIGIASHHGSVLLEILNYDEIDIIQIPMNIIENGLIKRVKNELKKKKIAIIGNKIFGGGILSSYFNTNDLIGYALCENIDSILIGFGKRHHVDDAITTLMNKTSLKKTDYSDIVKSKIGPLLNDYICNRCQKCSCELGIEIHKLLRYRMYYLLGNKKWAIRQFNRPKVRKDCNECNSCLPMCIQDIPIPELIEETKKLCHN